MARPGDASGRSTATCSCSDAIVAASEQSPAAPPGAARAAPVPAASPRSPGRPRSRRSRRPAPRAPRARPRARPAPRPSRASSRGTASSCGSSAPARSGSAHAITVSGRATSSSAASTASAGSRLLAQLVERDVRPEHDEHEQRDQVGRDGRRTGASRCSWHAVHRQPEVLHVADDQPRQERAEVAASARRVEREVADRDHGERRRAREDSRQTPARRLEMTAARPDPGDDADHRADPQVHEELRDGLADRAVPAEHHPGEGQRERGAGRVVEGGLRDHRLRQLRSHRERMNRGIRIAGSVGDSTAPSSTAPVQREVEHQVGHEAGDQRREHHARERRAGRGPPRPAGASPATGSARRRTGSATRPA